MKSFKVFACACLLAAGVSQAAPAQEPPLSQAAVSALRNHARDRIVETLEGLVVRPTEREVLLEDAKRISRRLDEAALRSIAAGEELDLRNVTAPALGSALTDLVFVPLAPCRIIDTRLAGGALAPGVPRDFQVAGTTEFGAQGGNLGGCGVPPGAAEPNAAAVVVNFIAVGPAGPGNLVAWAHGQPKPLASVINYSNVPGLNIANGVVVPIAGTNTVPADLSIQADVSGTHVVADVTGYFTRFNIDQFADNQKSITVVSEGGGVDLSDGACTAVSSCTITAEASGQVIIRAWAKVSINHATTPGGDRVAVGVKNVDPEICSNNDHSINATDFEVPESHGDDSDVDTTLSHKRIYAQTPGTRTYWINARMITGAGSGDVIEGTRMICTFIPNG